MVAIVSREQYEYAVVGAGPAGIAQVGALLFEGAKPQDICWIDKTFTGGDLATRWRNVSGNTPVEKFCAYFEQYDRQFGLDKQTVASYFGELAGDATCQLGLLAQPLHDATENLCNQVAPIYGNVSHLSSAQSGWELNLNDGGIIKANTVALATGSEPNNHHPYTKPAIPLEDAFNGELANHRDEKLLLVGSSHSAVIVMRAAAELGIPIVNIYRDDLRYATKHDGWVEHDTNGLKGTAAQWAHEHLDPGADLPDNFARFDLRDQSDANRTQMQAAINDCDHAIYATGFKRRPILVEGVDIDAYNPWSGKIAPYLFGVGIAFPELMRDPLGREEYRVGLSKFTAQTTKVAKAMIALTPSQTAMV